MSRSSFYNAFGSREALLKDLMIYYELQSPQIALVLATPPIDVGHLLRGLITELCDHHCQDNNRSGCLLTNLSIELRDDEPELQALLKQINQDRIARLIEICTWAVDGKELPRTTECARLGQQLFALIEQINLLARSLPDLEVLQGLALTELAQLGFTHK